MSGPEAPPVGGTTGMSHAHSAGFDQAVLYLVAAQPHELQPPLISRLEAMFGLTTAEALEADEQARRMRAGPEAVPSPRIELETISRLQPDGTVRVSEALNYWSGQSGRRLASVQLTIAGYPSVRLASGLRSQGVAETDIAVAIEALAKLRAARDGRPTSKVVELVPHERP